MNSPALLTSQTPLCTCPQSWRGRPCRRKRSQRPTYIQMQKKNEVVLIFLFLGGDVHLCLYAWVYSSSNNVTGFRIMIINSFYSGGQACLQGDVFTPFPLNSDGVTSAIKNSFSCNFLQQAHSFLVQSHRFSLVTRTSIPKKVPFQIAFF